MDPDRVRAYIQLACAGLGFDIGEVWFISEKQRNGSSSAPIADSIVPLEEKKNDMISTDLEKYSASSESQKKIRFLQLYTSKSYDKRRKDLVRPDGESDGNLPKFRRSSSTENLKKHVLSPRLVDAISNTMQVVWANSNKQEGLLGRSDMKLQTAVGMPVVMDAEGNMCVVVMFSPNNIQSSDDALEYLRTIRKSAAATSIPCLLPVINRNETNLLTYGKQVADEKRRNCDHTLISHDIGAGITARFVSCESEVSQDKFDSNGCLEKESKKSYISDVEVHNVHDLSSAPKDCYGIPMLPGFAEIGDEYDQMEDDRAGSSSPHSHVSAEAFDEASYGVWSTVMSAPSSKHLDNKKHIPKRPREMSLADEILISSSNLDDMSRHSSSSTLSQLGKPILMPQTREQMEEFITAFLHMSVFDVADVWIPTSTIESFDELNHCLSVVATNSNEGLNYFKEVSKDCSVKMWSGAVGRAYASGNPVWSSNTDVIVDSSRKLAFSKASIKTAMAIPIFPPGIMTPTCILCCYSLIKTDSVPFVLRFVQQALKLLWVGLDRIEPHESVGKELWKNVAGADLGEMAADLEMQKAFISKKRPLETITPKQEPGTQQFQSNIPNKSHSVSINKLSLNSEEPKNKTQFHPTYANPSGRALGPAPLLPKTLVTASMRNESKISHPPIKQPNHTNQHYNIQNQNNTVRSPIYPRQGAVVTESTPLWHTNQYTLHTNSLPTNMDDKKPSHVGHSTNINPNSYQPLHTISANGIKFDLQKSKPQSTSLRNVSLPPVSQSSKKMNINDFKYKQPAVLVLDIPQSVMSTNPILHNSHAPNIKQESDQTNETILANATDRKEDPDIARKNIEEFNAMARQSFATTYPNPIPNQTQSHYSKCSMDSVPTNPTNGITPPINDPQIQSPLDNSLSYRNQPVKQEVQQYPTGDAPFCVAISTQPTFVASIHPTGTSRPCRIQGCNDVAVSKRPYCARHSGNRTCEFPGCSKCAQGATRFCIAHGGGRRCTYPGCDKGARDKFFCAAHGGGRRCTVEGCSKSAVGGSKLCTSHGGGRRCAVDGCQKSAQSSTKFCVKHGGGKKCAHESCDKVARGRTMYCAAHGGGIRCQLEGCNRVAIGKKQLCRLHGGGTTSKSKRKKPTESQPPLPVTPSHFVSTNSS